MTTHTPGPWKREREPRGRWAVEVREADGLDRLIVVVDGEDSESNARLIAAAPELLELLSRVTERLALRAMDDHRFTSMNEKDDIDLARAAIAKVKGEK